MLHEFLDTNRTELIERCRAKVALRPAPSAMPSEMDGIPLFLGQLIQTLRSEPDGDDARGEAQMNATATRHGGELLQHGFTLDQVVHDYGDLCQAVTELAFERNAQVSVEEFHTLNRCLDNAIAGAVTEYARQTDGLAATDGNRAMGERLGALAHEMRNFLNTAMLSFEVIKGGTVALHGATSAALDRSLAGLRDLVDRALADVRLSAPMPVELERVPLDRFIAEVQVAATLEARSRGCRFTVFPVEPGIAIEADRAMLYSALSNLLQNAFKFTHAHGHVWLRAGAAGGRVLIDVEDQCGGLPEGAAETLFLPYEQRGTDRSGLGLGLSIAQRAVEASHGALRVRDIPGKGCVFTIDLPRRT